MRVLVTGGSGPIGSNYVKYFIEKGDEVHYTTFNNIMEIEGASRYTINFEKANEIKKTIKEIEPELIVHTVALPSVDLCEIDKILAYKINVEGTRTVLESSRALDSFIIYISTTAVFDGTKGVYYETDVPNPINNYARTKLLAEELVRGSGLGHIILRTDQPYGWIADGQKQNSVIRALNKIRNNETLNEVVDWYNNPTLLRDLINATDQLLKNGKEGTYNAVGPDYINRYEWSLLVAEIFGENNALVRPISYSNLNLAAKRPNTNASSDKIKREVGFSFVGVKEGLHIMKKEFMVD